MNIHTEQSKIAPDYLDLAAGKAATVQGQVGMVVSAVQGRVWLTQDGDTRDYLVPTGARYCVASRGRIVFSAIDGPSRIAIYRVRPRLAGLWSPNAVPFNINSAGTLENAARQLRADTTAALARRAWHQLRRQAQQAWQRLVQSRPATQNPLHLRACGYPATIPSHR